MNRTQLKRYAKLLAKTGINVVKGQWVVVSAELDQPEFVEMVVEELYRAGAGKVTVEWSHQPLMKTQYKFEKEQSLSALAKWEIEKLEYRKKELPAMLYLESEDPDGLAGIDQEKMTNVRSARMKVIKPYRDAMDNRYQWCIAAVAGKKWAKKVFPHLSVNQAVEKLWDAILAASRADGADPVREWARHNDDIAKRCDKLNRLGLVSLEYKSSNGTDFTVGLLPEAQFMGGGEEDLSGRYFNPNIPSEEIFTSPRAGAAEGIVYSAKPLSYQGELIENFSIRFENGKAVEVKAEKNAHLLEKMISMDEGAAKLGEVALIAYDSPINNTGLLFYNTLFDENASCHLALGMGFTNTIRGYENYTKEELHQMGINDSMIHVDFMIGSKDLDIVGVTKTGERVQIFKNGNWAF
ncbi:MAG: aminopeptidase [Clostridia bacterium]|jgi:aminopeptidase|nr:aminopeptidase [Clostridia bacterium]